VRPAPAADASTYGTLFGLITPVIYAGIALLIGVIGAALESLFARWTGDGEMEADY